MATKRTLSLTRQLKAALAAVDEQKAIAEKAQKELASATSAKESFYKQSTERQAELDQVHSLLDALPNAIPRQSEPGDYGQRTQHALMTRLAAWLATNRS